MRFCLFAARLFRAIKICCANQVLDECPFLESKRDSATKPRICLLIAGLLVGWSALAAEKSSTPRPGAEVDFNRDIRSILSENCYACHGPDDSKRKAKLRLDKQEDAFKPAKSAPWSGGGAGVDAIQRSQHWELLRGCSCWLWRLCLRFRRFGWALN